MEKMRIVVEEGGATAMSMMWRAMSRKIALGGGSRYVIGEDHTLASRWRRNGGHLGVKDGGQKDEGTRRRREWSCECERSQLSLRMGLEEMMRGCNNFL